VASTGTGLAAFAGRRVVVVGVARTGLAVARRLSAAGARVRLTDRRADLAVPADVAARVDVALGAEGPELLDGADLVVPSPGVPATAPLLAAAVARGVPILSEVEIAARAITAPLVAITGTNGKSTTTSLAGAMLATAGRAVFVGGNLGTPLIDAVGGRHDVVVAEISSFQLEWIDRFHPRVAAFLNVSDDHLDRHGDLASYARLKARVFDRQTAADAAVVNRDDAAVCAAARGLRARVQTFGTRPGAASGGFAEERRAELRAGAVVVAEPSSSFRLDLVRTPLLGLHNHENAMAAILIARELGCSADEMQRTLDGFTGLRHRMESVREVGGVAYVDDSKGTNVGALLRALESFGDGRVVLIAGGLAKEGDYAVARDLLARKVRSIQLYGAARGVLEESWRGVAEIGAHHGFHDAVAAAARAAMPGDVVLLSPACASMDQFTDYAARGDAFQALVRELGDRRAW
jgi:UDP-N-acetylmuramoylalanine--D-glutamate ligase